MNQINPAAFLGRGGGGGGGLKDLVALMEIAGVGVKGREQDIDEQKARALQAYYEGNLANERAKQVMEAGHYNVLEGIERDKMAQSALKNRVDFVKDLITSQYGQVPQALALRQLEGLPEEYSEPLKGYRDDLLSAGVEKFLPQIKAAYANKDPKKMKAALDVIFQNPAGYGGREVLNRMPWDELNQGVGLPANAGDTSGWAGATSLPWQEYKAPDFPIPNVFEMPKPMVSPDQALPWQRPEAPPANPALPWR
jgi:hypothetical protein